MPDTNSVITLAVFVADAVAMTNIVVVVTGSTRCGRITVIERPEQLLIQQ